MNRREALKTSPDARTLPHDLQDLLYLLQNNRDGARIAARVLEGKAGEMFAKSEITDEQFQTVLAFIEPKAEQ